MTIIVGNLSKEDLRHQRKMTEPKRDWTKIKYYPVSIKKLQNATMREAAYLIAPVNIGEDYDT